MDSGYSTGSQTDVPLYRPQDSYTSQDMNKTYTAGYLAGSFAGRLVKDVVAFSTSGLSLVMQFEALSQAPNELPPGISGIFGCGQLDPSPRTLGSKNLPFIQQLYLQGQLALPVFAISLSAYRDGESTPSGGT